MLPHCATVAKVRSCATLIGMAFGGWVSGAIHDWTGTYDLAFMHSIAWNLVNIAIIGTLWLRSRSGVEALMERG